MSNQVHKKIKELYQYFFAAAAGGGGLALVWNMLIPSSKKNAWLLGYSRSKWLLALFLFGCAIFFLMIMVNLVRGSNFGQKAVARFERLRPTFGGPLAFFLLCFSFFVNGQYIFLLLRNTGAGIIYSLMPLIFYVLYLCLLAVFVLWRLGRVTGAKGESFSNSTFLQISPIQAACYLGGFALVLVLSTLSGNYLARVAYDPKLHRVVTRTFVDEEANIPTYFSSLLLLANALITGFIALFKSRGKGRYRAHWFLLAFIMLVFSVDESSRLHELLNQPMEVLFRAEGIFMWGWVFVAIPFTILFGILFLRFVLHLPPRTRILFALSAALYVGGALGMELVGAGWVSENTKGNWTYIFISTTEELLEMSGLILFLFAQLDYFKTNFSELKFKVA